MIHFRQAIGHVRLLSAMLVAAAMLLAPLAHAMPVRCHDHATDALHVADSHGAAMADHHDERHGKAQMIDHGACCDLACSVWGIAIGSTDAAILHLNLLGHHPASSDRTLTGLVVLPGLDPPRS